MPESDDVKVSAIDLELDRDLPDAEKIDKLVTFCLDVLQTTAVALDLSGCTVSQTMVGELVKGMAANGHQGCAVMLLVTLLTEVGNGDPPEKSHVH